MPKRVIKYITSLIIICSFFSCDYFVFKKKESANKAIATFEGKTLQYDDIKEIVPQRMNENDSALVVKMIIDDWAIQQILIKKAEQNNTQATNSEIQKLVDEYRRSLLINRYKEELIQQELDTIVTDKEIEEYYQSNKNNFRLNEEVVQIRYANFDKNLIEKKDIIKSFKRGAIEDLEDLETKQLSFKMLMLNDSTWVSLNNVLKETTFLKSELLKNSELIQKEDSINLFLAVVKKVLTKNDIAPKEYIKDNIKQILLHKRKLEVIREIEKILLKDAIKEKQLIYK